MAQQVVNIGTGPDSGDGDPLRTAFDKLNDNNVELYAHLGAGGSAHALAVSGGAAGFFSGTEKAKLAGIAASATANSPDATLLDRTNHTGTQLAATISNLTEAVQDIIDGTFVEGSGINITYDDVANTITFEVTLTVAFNDLTSKPTTLGGYGIVDAAPLSHVGTGGAAHANAVASGAAGFITGANQAKLDGVQTGATANSSDATLLARANHTGTQSADTITDGTTNKAYTATEKTKLAGIATSATANSADATLLARANHTGSQAISTVTGLQTALDGKSATGHSHAIADTTGLQAALDAKAAIADVLAKASNLSDLSDFADARSNLGLVLGLDVQAYSDALDLLGATDPETYGISLLELADAAALRTIAGLVIGTNVQAYAANLAAIAALTSAADKLPYFSGSGAAALADFPAAARTLLAATTAAAQRTALGIPNVQMISGSTLGNTIAAGQTRYMTHGAPAATLGAVANNVTRAGVFKFLRFNSTAAPGASQTYTATLWVAGASTGLTCQISGAASFGATDLFNSAAATAGNNYGLQVVASAGAATANFSWNAEYEFS